MCCKVKEATLFAKERHEGQKDNNDEVYFNIHLLRVRNAVMEFTDDEDVICASVLHDIIEDTDTTYEELMQKFNKRIADLVMEVTHEGESDEHGYFFPRLKTAEAIMIKLCDRASNISRMENWNEKRKKHYLKRTKFWKHE